MRRPRPLEILRALLPGVHGGNITGVQLPPGEHFFAHGVLNMQTYAASNAPAPSGVGSNHTIGEVSLAK